MVLLCLYIFTCSKFSEDFLHRTAAVGPFYHISDPHSAKKLGFIFGCILILNGGISKHEAGEPVTVKERPQY